MVNVEIVCDLIGNVSVIDNIQEIKIDPFRSFFSVKPALRHTAYRTAATVFKNYLWLLRRIYFYLFDLLLIEQWNPIHENLGAFCEKSMNDVLRHRASDSAGTVAGCKGH